MPQPLSGPGIGLQVPQSLYPSNLTGGNIFTPTNVLSLAPGEALPIPAGRWEIDLGKYGSLQYLDPVTTSWTLLRSGTNNDGTAFIWSDGFNVRIANLTGCVAGAIVNVAGSGYTQSTTTITPSLGNSTWQAIVGGAVSTTVSVTTAGSGYGIAPLVFFDAPPSPGVQATGIAVLSGTSVSSITVLNQGAGYTTAPNVTILPNPADPNINSSITNATATATLTGSGTLTAAICTNPGVSVATTMSLTVAGTGGSSATVTPLFLQTVTSMSVTTAGGGYGTATKLTTMNGYNNTATVAYTNPTFQLQEFVPRQADIPLTITSGAVTSITSIVDGGLFITAPTPLPMTNGIITTLASLVLTMGSANISVRMQQVS